jgi:alkanesulfonate monooxygenase SsuD/methylene tetrahydromethanopterin reductase-like flavin-dependent oxidoreductase (luciferase family)
MTVRFSTRAPNADYLGFEASPEAMVAVAKKAEEVGFDAIFVNDHIIVGDDARLLIPGDVAQSCRSLFRHDVARLRRPAGGLVFGDAASIAARHQDETPRLVLRRIVAPSCRCRFPSNHEPRSMWNADGSCLRALL